MQKIKFALVLIISLFSFSCATTKQNRVDIEAIANDYFNIYAERKNFKKLMSFYAEQAHLEDLGYGHHAKSKKDIKQFFAWDDGKFSLVNSGPALVVQKQIIEGNKVATEGYFTEFIYDGQQMGPWRFLIWLEFNSAGKIIRHVDWINYTPKENFVGGQNLNSLISSPN